VELTIAQLAELTTTKHQTASKRLRAKGLAAVRTDGRGQFFDSVAALPIVLGSRDRALSALASMPRVPTGKSSRSRRNGANCSPPTTLGTVDAALMFRLSSAGRMEPNASSGSTCASARRTYALPTYDRSHSKEIVRVPSAWSTTRVERGLAL